MSDNISTQLLTYENYKIDNSIYENINIFADEILLQNKKKDNIIVYLINWGCGFGSALTVFIQNAYYLHTINPNIHVFPMFSQNTLHFKYSDDSLNNTFFRYFKYTSLPTNIDMEKYEIYFIKSSPTNRIDFFTSEFPPMKYSPSNIYISYFQDKYKLCIGDNIHEYIKNIKQPNMPLIGIHMRSIAQKKVHNNKYLEVSIIDRIKQIKLQLDGLYACYQIFIATDTMLYLDYAKNVFSNIHYIDSICRINNEGDSIPQLNLVGFKLGSDILYDCLALSLCDTIYISNSNIPFIISIINPMVNLIEY
jgi:hypothetical protein